VKKRVDQMLQGQTLRAPICSTSTAASAAEEGHRADEEVLQEMPYERWSG
jgi:hypothetical protein